MNSYESIIKALRDLAGGEISFSLSQTEEVSHGDYATNIAFPLSKQQEISPKECAEKVVTQLQEKLSSIVEKVEVAGPGFINFFLRDEVIRHENEKGEEQIVTKYTGKNVLVEHSSPNLFKPFSVGHLMNNIIGEFITRAMRSSGAHVKTMSFPSDVSLGIAKALMMIEKDIKEEKITPNFVSIGKEEAVVIYLGNAYVRGVAECEVSEVSLNQAKDILDKMYHLSNYPDFYALVREIRQINENYFKRILQVVGSDIEEHGFVYESWAGDVGEKIVKSNTGEGKVFTESEGAIIYSPVEERKDLHTAVFINSQGYPTYEAKDIGLIEIKFNGGVFLKEEEGFIPEYSFFVTDAEQISHFRIVLDAAAKLGSDWKERVLKSVHVPHGRMLFKGQKMSSRLGGVPLALDVIATVEEEVKERAGEKIAHLGGDEVKKLEREIALSALRIAVLRSKPGININFDPETSLSFEGDSGPYLLYTHARCSSLLEKGKDITPRWSDISVTSLEKKLIHFESELTYVCNELAPQKLTTYLFSVAQLFNSYYASTQIIVEGDEIGNAHRLMIVKRTKDVLKKGLYVLGIEAPERM